MFDLNVLSLQSTLPGLLALAAPRRAARGRKEDQLVLLLDVAGDAALPPAALERAAQIYFQSSTSVTAALRAAAESLNTALLERNLRASTPGTQSIGLLNLAAVHGEQLILGQSGPTHAFCLTGSGWQHLHDPQLAGRGLGLGRTLTLRYFQFELQAGMALVLCPEPPPAWTANGGLAGALGDGLDPLRRRLLSQAPPDLRAALIQFQPGAGMIHLISSTAVTPEPTVTAEPPAAPQHLAGAPAAPAPATTEAVEAQPAPAAAPEAHAWGEIPPMPEAPPWKETPPAPAPRAEVPPVTPPPAEAPSEATPSAWTPSAQPTPRRARRSGPPPFVRTLARLFRLGSRAQESSEQTLGRAFSRMLPGSGEGAPALTPGTMIFIAIAVPLVVVAVAMAVYFQRGRADQYRAYYAQAAAQAAQTQGQSDPAILRGEWEKTLFWLDKAEAYQKTGESRTLRQQAQAALDGLDSIVRLAYQPAIIGGLSQSIRVTRMVATADDLYLLDGSQGRVLRAVLTGRGFELDPNFACGPGPSGSIIINKLVDIAPLPPANEFKATVLAIDQDGNLLYCTPGSGFTAAPLAPPDNNWGEIRAMVLDGNSLYVLDPKTNAVWVYDGRVGDFSQRPRLIFDTTIPPMADVIDMTVGNQNLYLLHEDGHMTQCTYSSVSFEPTRCTDPAQYTDNRAGRNGRVDTFSDATFTQIYAIALPTPALYLLEPKNQSIFLFSLQLRLQNQYRADTASDTRLPNAPATAFTIGPNRLAFLAFGNQVYYAVGQ